MEDITPWEFGAICGLHIKTQRSRSIFILYRIKSRLKELRQLLTLKRVKYKSALPPITSKFSEFSAESINAAYP
jgi:hypothetical protein